MAETIIVGSTGLKQEAVQFHHAEIPPRVPGQHLWIVAGCWRVDPERMAGGTVHLDTENMLTLDGPGCYWCEEHYSSKLAAKPCRGEGAKR